jgi:hypothetical protein
LGAGYRSFTTQSGSKYAEGRMSTSRLRCSTSPENDHGRRAWLISYEVFAIPSTLSRSAALFGDRARGPRTAVLANPSADHE